MSSSTTTGGAKPFGTTATVVAAIAATRTIAKKEEESTSITLRRSYVRPTREWKGGRQVLPKNKYLPKTIETMRARTPMSSAPTRIITSIFTTAVASLMLVLPATAGAATSKYPPSSAARGFVGGTAGWTSSSANEGICLPPVLCAGVTNSYQGSGGTDGGGFIRSAYLGVAGATAVGGTTSGTWESPSFAYEGAGGEAAGAVNFSLDRRSSVDQFLGLDGNSAEYTVRLLDLSEGGEATTLIAPTTLAGADSWTSVGRGSIPPQSLASGHGYRIQITSTYPPEPLSWPVATPTTTTSSSLPPTEAVAAAKVVKAAKAKGKVAAVRER
jgi:hypothetical protein